LDEPELEDPVSGVEPLGAPGVPGNVPHGDRVFGFTVDGWVVLPGVGGLGEFDPGTLDGDVGGLTEPVGGGTGVLVGGGVGVGAPGA